MTDKIFHVAGIRAEAERDAYSKAHNEAVSLLQEWREAVIAQIAAELDAAGIKIGDLVVATVRTWQANEDALGILRSFDHNGVVVAVRKNDGTAHKINNIWGVISIRPDESAVQP